MAAVASATRRHVRTLSEVASVNPMVSNVYAQFDRVVSGDESDNSISSGSGRDTSNSNNDSHNNNNNNDNHNNASSNKINSSNDTASPATIAPAVVSTPPTAITTTTTTNDNTTSTVGVEMRSVARTVVLIDPSIFTSTHQRAAAHRSSSRGSKRRARTGSYEKKRDVKEMKKMMNGGEEDMASSDATAPLQRKWTRTVVI